MSLRIKSSQVPLIAPVSVLVPIGVTRVISFPQEFLGKAVSIRISNNDAVNIVTYQVDGESSPVLTLAANANRSINNTDVKLLRVTAGAAGTCQVEAQVLPMRESEL